MLDGVLDPQGNRRFGVKTFGQSMQLHISAATWAIETKSTFEFLPNYFGVCYTFVICVITYE